MPLFITDVELKRCSHNASLIAYKADSFIRALQLELETVKAQADASSITSEQTCALIEQKYLSLSSDFAELQSQNTQLSTSLEKRLSELIEVQAEKKQLHIKAISKHGDVEQLSVEASEHHKSKRQLVEMLGQKDIEIGEKNATIKSYLDKIKANEEILKLKDEAQAYKDHMLQYKEIAQVNEVSLKQMDSAHERFKAEVDKLKKSLEAEILSLRSMVSELESDVLSMITEAASAVAEKEEVLSSALAEIKRLNEDNSGKNCPDGGFGSSDVFFEGRSGEGGAAVVHSTEQLSKTDVLVELKLVTKNRIVACLFQKQHWQLHFCVMVGVWLECMRSVKKLLMLCITSSWDESIHKPFWNGFCMKWRRKLKSFRMSERNMREWWKHTICESKIAADTFRECLLREYHPGVEGRLEEA